MRIRAKISFFVIPLAMLPLLLIGLYSYRSLIKGFEEQAYLDDQQLCLLAATRIEQELDECHDGLLLIASLLSPHLIKPDGQRLEQLIAGANPPIEEVAQSLVIRHSPHVRIRLIAPDGKELLIAPGLAKELKPGSALDEPIFLQAVSVQGQFPPIKRDHDQGWTTTFSTHLQHDLTLKGFIFLDLDLEALSKTLRDLAKARPGYYFLFDGSGRILAEGGEAPLSESDRGHENYRSSLEQVRARPQPVFTHTAYRAGGRQFFLGSRPVKEYIAFTEPIPEERWYLAVMRAETPLLSAFRQSQRVFLMIVVFGFIVAVAGAFYISQKITAPISQLAMATQEFAKGHLESNIDITTPDEIGELATDFNQMATDLKQHIRERQANETLITIGRFSAALAHDLRNPIEGLKLLSREFRKRVSSHRPEYEIADTIAQSVDRLSSLVNQSLDFARLTQPAYAPANLMVLAEEALQDFRFDEVELKKDYAHDLPLIEVDVVQIKRVLSNLIRNALEACLSKKDSARCQISLKLQTRGEKVRLEVADTGAGIPPEIGEKIFEPFFSTKPGGHGLGLALARQIISNHGGTITFSSEIGQGTRFVIELPI